MGWKDWPYWLKGGIIWGLLFSLISLAVVSFTDFFILLFPFLYEPLYNRAYGTELFYYPFENGISTIGIIFSSITGFIIGTIVISIYGEIKGKERSKKLPYWLVGGLIGHIITLAGYTGMLLSTVISNALNGVIMSYDLLATKEIILSLTKGVIIGALIGWLYGKFKERRKQ